MNEGREEYEARLDTLFAPIEGELARLRAEMARLKLPYRATVPAPEPPPAVPPA